MRRFTLTEDGKLTSISQLAKEFGRGRSVVHRAIDSALREGRVHVSAILTPPPLPTDEQLGERLCAAYDLRHATVVDTRRACVEARRAPAEGTRLAAGGDDAEAVHIGWAMGRYIAEHAEWIFDPDDLVLIGGGRDVYHTVRALRILVPTESWPRVTVAALYGATGELDPEVIEGEIVRRDADPQAVWLYPRFRQGSRLLLVAHRIAVERGSVAETMEHSWFRLFGEARRRVAIVGLEVTSDYYSDRYMLGASHKGSLEELMPFLAPIAGRLQEVNTLSRRYSTDDYCPVADVCARMFFVEPPPGVTIPATDRARMQDLVNEIDEHIVGIPLADLPEIDSIHLVTAGVAKSRAIHTVLTGRWPATRLRVRTLVTDTPTARRILEYEASERA